MAFRLFKFNVATQELEFMDDDALAVREFAHIWNKKLPVKGDADCKKKLYNRAILTYITFICDSNLYKGFDENTRHIKAAEDSGLFDIDKNWYPEDFVNLGIAKYHEIMEDYIPSHALLNELQQGIKYTAASIKIYRQQLKKFTEVLDRLLNDDAQAMDDSTIGSITAANEIIQKNIVAMMDVTNKLPKTIDTLTELEEKVREEKIKSKNRKGGYELGNREDPHNRF